MEELRIYETNTCSLGAELSQVKEKAIQRGHLEPGHWSMIAWVGLPLPRSSGVSLGKSSIFSMLHLLWNMDCNHACYVGLR